MIDVRTWWHNIRPAASAGPAGPADPPKPGIGLPERIAEARDFAEGLVRTAIDRARALVAGPPQGPFPTMADLAARFPRAGLPPKIMGTTIDFDATRRPGVTPDGIMAKARAMGLNAVRLGAYWDQIQKDGPDRFDYRELDALLDAAQRHGIRVILSVGVKGPAWPEYHVPAWATSASSSHEPGRDPAFRRNAEAFVREVARHVAGHDAICMWQVENEPFDPAGPQRLWLGSDMVAREAALLRAADGGRRPVMINGWSAGDRRDELDRAFAIADLVGLDVYRRAPAAIGRYEREVAVPSYALEQAKRTGKPAMIAELQADDWGDYKANAADVADLTRDLQALGYRDFLFWRMRQNLANEAKGNDDLTRIEADLAREALEPAS